MFELEGSYSRAKYPTLNSYYNTFVAAGNLGWKFWQDRDYRSYIAVLGTAGYAMQKSDKDDAELFQRTMALRLAHSCVELGVLENVSSS